jgi:hypothetical protein
VTAQPSPTRENVSSCSTSSGRRNSIGGFATIKAGAIPLDRLLPNLTPSLRKMENDRANFRSFSTQWERLDK